MENHTICKIAIGCGGLDRMAIEEASLREFNEGGPDVIKGFLIVSGVTGLVGKAAN